MTDRARPLEPVPWGVKPPDAAPAEPVMIADLRRCIGCHACSVACKVEHAVPLGEFRMRVRWLEAKNGQIAFVPLFDANTCDYGANRATVGMTPACVAACPTGALIFGDGADKSGSVAAYTKVHKAAPLPQPGDSKTSVRYVGHEPWMDAKLNRGVALDPADDDITYEQR